MHRLVDLRRAAAGAACALLAVPGAALAGTGQPSPWQLNLQGAASDVMASVHNFHWLLLVIITAISLFVLGLLLIVMARYNARANPVPSRTTHHTGLEVAWTVVPVIILLVIAVPSFRLLWKEQTIPPPDMTVKAIGKQWFWTYEYPDHNNLTFDQFMLQDKERQADQPRLLAVDNEVVVPVGKVVRVQVTAADVLHAFAVPSFGIKIDAVPGRLNETWFRASQEGIFYGQCSELCGKDHAFMPIAVRVVSDAKFSEWLTAAQKRAEQGKPPLSVAELAAQRTAALADTDAGTQSE